MLILTFVGHFLTYLGRYMGLLQWIWSVHTTLIYSYSFSISVGSMFIASTTTLYLNFFKVIISLNMNVMGQACVTMYGWFFVWNWSQSTVKWINGIYVKKCSLRWKKITIKTLTFIIQFKLTPLLLLTTAHYSMTSDRNHTTLSWNVKS